MMSTEFTEKISACFWTYKRIEPPNLHITVTYFPSASEFDSGPVIQVNTIWRSDSTLDTYLVCWDNRIVVIKFYWDPPPGTDCHCSGKTQKLTHNKGEVIF